MLEMVNMTNTFTYEIAKTRNADLARTKKALKCHQTLSLAELEGGVWGRDYARA